MTHFKAITPDNSPYCILKFKKCNSTNTYTKENANALQDNTIIWAERQTSGRGRFSRVWNSIAYKDLTFSIFLPLIGYKATEWQNIAQIVSFTLSKHLETYDIVSQIKWPNDLLVNGKKICGILCETINHNQKTYAIIGIGINVNSNHKDLALIDQPATSIFNELNKEIDREQFFKTYLKMLFSAFDELKNHGFNQFYDKINKRLAYKGISKSVSDGINNFQGRIIGLNNDGTLKFCCDDGEIMDFCSGEISFNQ